MSATETNVSSVPVSSNAHDATCDMTKLMLPNVWVVYIYDKNAFKEITKHSTSGSKPYREICKLSSVNDVIYFIKWMGQTVDTEETSASTVPSDSKLNLDMNDYIIMREGIEPIWEDPRNSHGGTFTIKMDHRRGYEIWCKFIMYMVGETLITDMKNINGITVSYISDSYSVGPPAATKTYTYLKVWDGCPRESTKDFVMLLPIDIMTVISKESLKYTLNSTKKHYGNEDIIKKIKRYDDDDDYNYGRGYGGRNSYGGRGGNRGYGGRGGNRGGYDRGYDRGYGRRR
jgi:hypothetical protein